MSNFMGKMRIGKCYQHPLILFLNIHYAFQRMFLFFSLFDVADKMQDLLFMPFKKIPTQTQIARRHLVLDSGTCRANVFMCICIHGCL